MSGLAIEGTMADEVVTDALSLGIASALVGEVVTGDRFLENAWTKAGEIRRVALRRRVRWTATQRTRESSRSLRPASPCRR